jgi:succinate dehydrogenase / fumarate reductase cytochrome b subunit
MIKSPKNLNLFTIRFPVPAMVSILHRVSGVVLFVFMPLLTMSLYWSTRNEAIFHLILQAFDTTVLKIIKTLMIWGIIHHLIAGTRHIMLDLHYGMDLIVARFTSKIVLIISFIMTLFVGYWVW